MKQDNQHHYGDCALHRAIEVGDVQQLRTLLEQGADVEAVCWIGSYNWTPLKLAAHYGNLEIVYLLLERGASVHFRNLHGGTPLMAAVCEGHVAVAEVLFQAGADVNARGGEMMATTLMGAIASQNLAGIRFLLAHGVDINARDSKGRTALTWAELMEDLMGAEAVTLLKQAGAEY